MKELQPLIIEGNIGGNQDWFSDYWMKLGGCAAITACDSCIYFAWDFNLPALYPFDYKQVTKKEYIEFSKIMKPYLKPRYSGIDRLGIYIDGLGKYLEDKHVSGVSLVGVSAECTYENYQNAVKTQIDKNIPIPCLVLRHKNKLLEDYVWHWFLIMGYDDTAEDFLVKTVTYNIEKWFSLKDIWDSGYKKKGGIIVFQIENAHK